MITKIKRYVSFIKFFTLAGIFFCFFIPSATFAATQTWHSVDTSTMGETIDNSWNSVAWSPSLGRYVALAAALDNNNDTCDSVMTSSDGITWTIGTTPHQLSPVACVSNWQSVVWSPELNLFVAVSSAGTGNRSMTSPDGLTWTLGTSPADNSWISVAWSPSLALFVAVSIDGAAGTRTMYSSNGSSWTVGTSMDANVDANAWRSVAWSPSLGMFVAVAGTGSGTSRVMRSTDGIHWASEVSSNDTNNWNGVTWSPTVTYTPTGACPSGVGLFVAVAGTGSSRVMTSCDGLSWTPHTSGLETTLWTAVAWAASSSLATANSCATGGGTGVFVGVARSGAGNRVETSCDGVTWTSSAAAAANAWQAVVWSPSLGRFVSVSNSGTNNRVMTSPDSLVWTPRATSYVLQSMWENIVWSPELHLFVAVSFDNLNGRDVMTSPDGYTWTMRNTPAGGSFYWIGVTWAASAPKRGTSGTGIFVAVADSGTAATEVMTSNDGISWSTSTAASAQSWNSVAWSPTVVDPLSGLTGMFVAVAETGTTAQQVMTSHDGITWTSRSEPSTSGWASVIWAPEAGLFVATSDTMAGTTGHVMTSPDGVNWTSHDTPIANHQWNSVTWSPTVVDPLTGLTGLFVSVSTTGSVSDEVMTSHDGATWTLRTIPSTNQWVSVTWGDRAGLFVAVAQDGPNTKVMTSPDGVTWTNQGAVPENLLWAWVAWSPQLGVFVAVADSHDNQSPIGNRAMITGPALPFSVSATPTSTGATITWTTDVASTSQVNYGATSSYGAPGSPTTLDSTLVTSHSVILTGLTCGGATYHYQALSTEGTVSSSSVDATFVTGACASAPTVTTSAASPIGATTATLNGNITATGGTNPTVRGFNYGLTTGYELTPTSESGSFSTGTFFANLTGLACVTTYHFQSYATNTAGTATSTPDVTFTTAACPVAVVTTSGGARGVPPSITPTGAGGQSLDFTINDGAKTTSSPILSLTSNANPATVSGYAVSLEPTFTNVSIHTYAPTVSFTLPNTSGQYTLYVKYFSSVGDHSEVISHIISYIGGGITPTTPTVPGAAFTHTLKIGSTDSEVKQLQQFLNTHGFTLSVAGPGSSGNETSYYGTLTTAALVKFQEAHMTEILTPLGLLRGTGNFGPATMRVVNGMLK